MRPSSAASSALLGAATAALVAAVFSATPLARLETGPYDLLARWTADPEKARGSRVRLVLRGAANRETAAALWAETIDRLAARRPAAILLDDADAIAAIGAGGAGRDLRRAMQRSGRVVVPLHPRPDSGDAPPPEGASVAVYGPTDDLPPAGPLPPLAEDLVEAAARFGLVRLDADADGVARRVPLVARAQDADVPTVPLACAMTAFGESSVHLADGGGRLSRFAGIDVPLDASALRLRYRGRAGSFPTTDATSLLHALRDGGPTSPWLVDLGDRPIVLLGTNDAAATVATPVDDTLPRVEVFATALDNLIRADALRPAGLPAHLLLAAALGAAAALLARTPRRRALLAGAGLLATLFAFTWLAFALGFVVQQVGVVAGAAAAMAAGREWRGRRGA